MHVGFADPYCPNGRHTVVTVAAGQEWAPRDGGTLVVIQGPRFSSRAESQHHTAQGWTVVGMTGQPEATLAREMALCYTSIAIVTDLDVAKGILDDVVEKIMGGKVEPLQSYLDSYRS